MLKALLSLGCLKLSGTLAWCLARLTIRASRMEPLLDRYTNRGNFEHRANPKRMTAVQLGFDGRVALTADKFGDVYALQIGEEALPPEPAWQYLLRQPVYVAGDACVEPVMGHLSIITSLAIDPGGHLIASADIEGQIRISAFPEVYRVEQIYSSCGGDPSWCTSSDFITRLSWKHGSQTPTLIGAGTDVWFVAKQVKPVPAARDTCDGESCWRIWGGRLGSLRGTGAAYEGSTSDENASMVARAPSEGAAGRALGRASGLESCSTHGFTWICLDIDARLTLALWGNAQHQTCFSIISLMNAESESALHRLNERLGDARARYRTRIPTGCCSLPLSTCLPKGREHQLRSLSTPVELCSMIFVPTAPGPLDAAVCSMHETGARWTPEVTRTSTDVSEPEAVRFFFVLPFVESDDPAAEDALLPLAATMQWTLNQSVATCIRESSGAFSTSERANTPYNALHHSGWSWIFDQACNAVTGGDGSPAPVPTPTTETSR